MSMLLPRWDETSLPVLSTVNQCKCLSSIISYLDPALLSVLGKYPCADKFKHLPAWRKKEEAGQSGCFSRQGKWTTTPNTGTKEAAFLRSSFQF